MSACVRCGHNPEAVVTARWSKAFDREIKSLNESSTNKGAYRWQYKRDRDAWSWLLRAWHLEARIPIATRLRRVTITRSYTGRQREFDEGNFVGGCKGLVDALVRERLLVDDTRALAEIHYVQVKSTVSATEIVIEELAAE